jgi:hypothetical protein
MQWVVEREDRAFLDRPDDAAADTLSAADLLVDRLLGSDVLCRADWALVHDRLACGVDLAIGGAVLDEELVPVDNGWMV